MRWQVTLSLANALNASASIFDVLAEVDAKFVKIADKEYDAISKEVKKWFKKLAVRYLCFCNLGDHSFILPQKEEKAHDERIAGSNAKIKQAGIPSPPESNVNRSLPRTHQASILRKSPKKGLGTCQRNTPSIFN
jgi:hypothetical protein